MALITCPECGKQISDLAQSCPNCGFPIGFMSSKNEEKNEEVSKENSKENEKRYYENANSFNKNQKEQPIRAYVHETKKYSVLSIIAFIFSILGFTFFIGIIFSAIDLYRKDGKKKTLSIVALCISIIWLIVVATTGREEKENGNDVAVETENQNIVQDSEHNKDESKENNTEKEIEEKSVEENVVEKAEVVQQEETIEYEDVFFYDLMDNLDYYNGKYVRTVIQVSTCYQNDDTTYIKSQYADYDLTENSSSITIYPDNYQDFEYDEYITVEGWLAKDGNSDILINAHIVDSGDDSRETFENDLEICKEEYRKKLMSQRELFIESCVEVSYDDLRRYPDTYKDKLLKMKIYAEDVEPDGWIFPGDIIATYQGEELAVYDDRAVREPRILEGDTITVYAVGYGLTKMQVKQKGLVFNKTVDEYDVPAIQIKYTEKDDLSSQSAGENEESDANRNGSETGENVNNKLESNDWDENKDNAREAGKKAAEFINSLVE